MTDQPKLAKALLGERIRDRRLELGLSQEDAAVLASMHSTNLGKIERGQANPSLETIVRIAVALEVDPGDLVTGFGRDQLTPVEHMLTARELLQERRIRAVNRRGPYKLGQQGSAQ